jgi:hypothetical protein
MVRAAYLAMELIARFVIVPLAFASLLTGLIQFLGTPVGLVPALLGRSEALADGLCRRRPPGQDGAYRLRGPPGRRDDIVRCLSSRSGNPARGPRRWWSAGVARARGALSVQAAGRDPVLEARTA